MTTPTKLKNYDSPNGDTESVQLFYNDEVVSLITDKPSDVIVSLRDWFDKVGKTYNCREDNDLLFDIVNYLKNEFIFLGWEVYSYNIQKEVGFNIVTGENDHIRVYYYENITPLETWF